MVGTDTFTIDAIGSADPYYAILPGKRVMFRETGGGATAGYSLRAPQLSFPQRDFVPGEACVLEPVGGFQPGDKIGYFESGSGTLVLEVLYDHGL